MGNSRKLPVSGFKWVEDTSQLSKDFIENFNEDSDEGYFLEVDVQSLENLHNFHNDIYFLPEKMKIQKIKKLVGNLHNKTEYAMTIRNLKQALRHGLVLEKVHRVTKVNQKAWIKSYIDRNTEIRKKTKNDFEK